MGSGGKTPKPSKARPSAATDKKRKRLPLGNESSKSEKKKTKKQEEKDKNINADGSGDKDEFQHKTSAGGGDGDVGAITKPATASQQLSFFLRQFESANSVQLSSLELESFKEKCVLELSQSNSTLADHIKAAFGRSWEEMLCENKVMEGKFGPGNPAVLVISSSALRSLELLRELRPLTQICHAAKLFAKHMKIEDQVALLNKRVNIASGTPSRIKKLIDMEALGLHRLAVLVLDMHTDVKGYSLLTLPQVRQEFWDLYKCYFHQHILEGNLRICLYGPIPASSDGKLNRIKDSSRL